MTSLTVRHAACIMAAQRLTTPGGMPVLHLALTGYGTSQDVAVCLERLSDSGALTGVSRFVLDARNYSSTVTVQGQAAQAKALLALGTQALWLCQISEEEHAGLILRLLRDVYRAKGISITTECRPTVQAALAWLDQS